MFNTYVPESPPNPLVVIATPRKQISSHTASDICTEQGPTAKLRLFAAALFGLKVEHMSKMGLFSRKSSVVSENSSSLKNRSLTNRTSAASMGASSKLSFFGNKSKAAPSTPNMSLAKPPDPRVDPAAYLRSIHAVRERTRIVLDKAKANKLTHFVVDMSKFQECADYVVMIIKVQWPY